MPRLSIWAVCLALFAQAADDVDHLAMELKLSRALKAGETVVLQVRLGVLPRGREVEVTTDKGRALGTISPFGVPLGQAAGTYSLPVPAEVLVDGHVSVHLSVSLPANKKRKPTTEEVKSVRLAISSPEPEKPKPGQPPSR